MSLISLSISLRVCACKAETNIMSIIALCLPREGKNARKCVAVRFCLCSCVVVSFVARRLFVLLSLISSCSHHTCETFEHPERRKHRRVLFSTSIIHTRHHASVPIIIHHRAQFMRAVCGQETPNEEAKNLNNGQGARVYRDG